MSWLSSLFGSKKEEFIPTMSWEDFLAKYPVPQEFLDSLSEYIDDHKAVHNCGPCPARSGITLYQVVNLIMEHEKNEN